MTMYSIDEIYEMLYWNSDPETQQKGIQEGSKIKSLYVFILPTVNPPMNSKGVWDNCAEILASKSDEELRPYFYHLFKWLEDMNWPGAITIYDRLKKVPKDMLKRYLEYSIGEAQRTNNSCWKSSLIEFRDSTKDTYL